MITVLLYAYKYKYQNVLYIFVHIGTACLIISWYTYRTTSKYTYRALFSDSQSSYDTCTAVSTTRTYCRSVSRQVQTAYLSEDLYDVLCLMRFRLYIRSTMKIINTLVQVHVQRLHPARDRRESGTSCLPGTNHVCCADGRCWIGRTPRRSSPLGSRTFVHVDISKLRALYISQRVFVPALNNEETNAQIPRLVYASGTRVTDRATETPCIYQPYKYK